MDCRFEMARVLIAQAAQRRKDIGDDHGDPYEKALQTEVVPIELMVWFKEILDHSRAALDYCARELVGRYSPSTIGKDIYFPIAARGSAKADFRSLVGKKMPGILNTRPAVVDILESFQSFASPNNGWLADLATLCNESKHDRLSLVKCSRASVKMWQDELGINRMEMHKPDGSALSPKCLMILRMPGNEFPLDGYGHAVYISVDTINEELTGFLDRTATGIEEIISVLEKSCLA